MTDLLVLRVARAKARAALNVYLAASETHDAAVEWRAYLAACDAENAAVDALPTLDKESRSWAPECYR